MTLIDLDQPIIKPFPIGSRVLVKTRGDVYYGEVGTVQGSPWAGWHDVLFTDGATHPYADWELSDAE